MPETHVKLHLVCNKGTFNHENISRLLSSEILGVLSPHQVNQTTPQHSVTQLKFLGRLLNGILHSSPGHIMQVPVVPRYFGGKPLDQFLQRFK